MAILARNLRLFSIHLPEPINFKLGPREERVFEFVEYDESINTEPIANLIASGNVEIINVDASTTEASDEEVLLFQQDTSAMSGLEAGYVSANNIWSPADASSATGTFRSATFGGVFLGTPNLIVVGGTVPARFDGGLIPIPVAGDPVFLSWVSSGQFRNRPPTLNSGHWLTRVGIVLDASLYAAASRCTIVLQPDTALKR
jgi:hypothetical protein